MTPKPEPEWRACPCAVRSYRDTPPWAYRWCRLLPCGRVAVSRHTCLACPVPDCDAALEAEEEADRLTSKSFDQWKEGEYSMAERTREECAYWRTRGEELRRVALAKLRQARNEARTHRKDGAA